MQAVRAMSDAVPAVQPSSLTWLTAEDVYLHPEEVLAHLRREIETAERRAQAQRVPGKPILAVTSCLSTVATPSALKG